MLINGEEHNDLCVGIDLGTTNSVLATVNIRPNGNIVSKVVELDRAVDMFNAGQGAKFTLKKNPTTMTKKIISRLSATSRRADTLFARILSPNQLKVRWGRHLPKGFRPMCPIKRPRKFHQEFWNTCCATPRKFITLKKLMTQLSRCRRISIS